MNLRCRINVIISKEIGYVYQFFDTTNMYLRMELKNER